MYSIRVERLCTLINKGAKIIKNRFSDQYKGAKKSLGNIYDLVHKSSVSMIEEILAPNSTLEHDGNRRISLLQNITNEDETDAKQMDISALIIQDKLVCYN